jgi:hypothetical protein
MDLIRCDESNDVREALSPQGSGDMDVGISTSISDRETDAGRPWYAPILLLAQIVNVQSRKCGESIDEPFHAVCSPPYTTPDLFRFRVKSVPWSFAMHAVLDGQFDS